MVERLHVWPLNEKLVQPHLHVDIIFDTYSIPFNWWWNWRFYNQCKQIEDFMELHSSEINMFSTIFQNIMNIPFCVYPTDKIAFRNPIEYRLHTFSKCGREVDVKIIIRLQLKCELHINSNFFDSSNWTGVLYSFTSIAIFSHLMLIGNCSLGCNWTIWLSKL